MKLVLEQGGTLPPAEKLLFDKWDHARLEIANGGGMLILLNHILFITIIIIITISCI